MKHDTFRELACNLDELETEICAKPRRENISQQGHKGRKDRPCEFLKSVFVAFAILL